jgi:multiple sugar transport system substrate-binding protein
MTNKIKTLALMPVLLLLLTACTLLQDLPVIGKYFGSAPTGPVTLNVWGLWEDPQVMQTLIQKYQDENPNVTINYEDRSVMRLVEYKERAFARASEERSDIDIIMVHNSWVPRMSSVLAPIPSNLMNVATYTERFYPVAVQSAVINNDIYALPFYHDGLVLVYNRSHFAEVGQSLPPTAWEEFRRLALQLTVRGGEREEDIIRGGAAIGTADNINHATDIIGLMWSQAGVSIPSGIDSKPAVDAVSYYTNFAKEDKVWDNTMPEASLAFVNERASMIFIPSWQLIDILRYMPNVEDVGVAPVPQAIPQNPATWGSFWMYTVLGNSANKNAAWHFLDYLTSDETQLAYYNEASKVRFFGVPYSSTTLASQVPTPILRPVIDTAPFAKSGEIAARAGNQRQENALKKAINDILGNGVTEVVLQEAKLEINQ